MKGTAQELGLNFLVGLADSSLSSEETQLLKELKPVGIILFSYNLDHKDSRWSEKLAALISTARDAAGRNDFLVSVDHEGGRVHRFPPPVTHFPPALNWTEKSADVGTAIGRELRALGFNLNFAPVLDVWSNPVNQVIGDRALSKDPQLTAQYSQAFFSAMEAEGVLACGKHFPGHGATTADSHLELPVLDESEDVLGTRDLLPFAEAIARGLQLIMTAHVLYPQLDRENPATVSKTILGNLLREQLKFSGCVISDGLEMKALSGISTEQVGSLGVNAGVDILLVAQPKGTLPLKLAQEISAGLIKALDKGDVAAETIQLTQKRINELFSRLAKICAKQSNDSYPLSLVGCEEHCELADGLEQ